MNKKTRTLALGLLSLGFAAGLSACGAPEGDAADAAGEAQVGKTSSALASCNAPIRAHATWIAASDPSAPTNFVSAHVVAPGINRVMWIDRQGVLVTPPFCLPGGGCYPGSSYYTISGAFAGDTISVDSEGSMTINGVRVTPTSCTVPSGPGSSRIVGRAASGAVYTVTMYNQYLG